MKSPFSATIEPALLAGIKTKKWYRHGMYRDNILFASAQLAGLGKEFFADEWLDRSVGNLIRLNDEAYLDESEFKEISRVMLQKIKLEPGYLPRYVAAYTADNDHVLKLARTIGSQIFTEQSSRELAEMFKQFYDASLCLTHWLWSMEFLNDAVDSYVKDRLRAWEPAWTEDTIQNFLTDISYLPKQFPFQKELSEIEICNLDDDQVLSDMHNRYSWLNMFTWDAVEPWSKSDYRERVLEIKRKPTLAADNFQSREQARKATTLIGQVEDENIRNLLIVVQNLIYLKTERIDVFTRSWLSVAPLLKEIAARIDLPFVDFPKLTFEEIFDALTNGVIFHEDQLAERQRYALIRINDTLKYVYGDAHRLVSENVYKISAQHGISEVRGTVGYPGIVRGPAKILFTDRDLYKLNVGDILIANLTNPNYNPAFAKVAGIVTDEGGVLCHSAIMAREFKLPCVIGTRIATKVFEDGDMVEVDAEMGIVRKI